MSRRLAPSLHARLILGFLLVAIPAVGIMGAIGFYALQDLTRANQGLQEISRSLAAVRALEGGVGQAMMPISEFVAYGASGQDQLFKTRIGDIESQLDSCGSSTCHGATTQPREMAQKLAPHVGIIKTRASQLFREDAASAERLRLFREITEQDRLVRTMLEHMSSALLLRVQSLEEQAQQVYRHAWSFILAAIVLVGGFAVLIAWLMSRQLVRPIHELVAGTRHVMRGDLEYRVAVSEDGEIGELMRSFNAMAEEIAEHRRRLEKLVKARTTELEQAHDSLMRSEKLASIGVLASGVAHELNNPLTSILMNVNLLIEEAADRPELRRELKRVNDDVLRCKRIIEDLRDFSRHHDLTIARCDLNGVVRDVLGLITRQLDLQKIALAQDLCAGLPGVCCDPDRMRQALMNVFVNAIQAMPGGGALHVASGLREGYAVITVADTGPGIPGDIRRKVFDPFFTTKAEGTGLGLSIVHGIMEKHGGRAEIESPAAGAATGTAVRLLLPLEENRR